MNLSEPLDGLTSAVESAVLRVLARTDVGFSGREANRLAGIGSTASVHRTLIRLVNVGVVSAEPRPPSIIYRINRQHALWPTIELGLAARTRVFDSIGRFCAEELPEGLDLTVVVYGSVARRESTLDSDIDLLVVYPTGTDEDAAADYNYQLNQHVELLTGNEVQIVAMDRRHLSRRIGEGDALVGNVLADGILLHGRPLTPARKARAS